MKTLLLFLLIVFIGCQSQPEKLELLAGEEYCDCLKQKVKFPDCISNTRNQLVGECLSEFTDNYFERIMAMRLVMDSLEFEEYNYFFPIKMSEGIFKNCFEACHCLLKEEFNKSIFNSMMSHYSEFINIEMASICIEENGLNYLCDGGALEVRDDGKKYEKEMKDIMQKCFKLNSKNNILPQYSNKEEALDACIVFFSEDPNLNHIDPVKYCTCLTAQEVMPKEFIDIVIDRVLNTSIYSSHCFEQARKTKQV